MYFRFIPDEGMYIVLISINCHYLTHIKRGRCCQMAVNMGLRDFPCTWIMGGGACVRAVARRLRDHTSLA